MWDKLDTYEKTHNMLKQGDHIIIGLSGGADSICLSEFLLHKRQEYQLNLHAVHVNHMLRGEEALRDEMFVVDYCNRKGITCHVCRKDVEEYARQCHISVEEAGRQFRYECFEKVAKDVELKTQSSNSVKIAVAHHENDQAETLLFRITRGTGPSGLCGMSPVSSVYGRILIRPLLAITRDEVLFLLDQLSEDYVTDSTNLTDEHDRNLIRNHVIPTLTKMNTGAIRHISLLADQMRETMEYLDLQLDKLFETHIVAKKDGVFLDEKVYSQLTAFEQKEICRRMLYHVSGKKKDITSDHVNILCGLMDKRVGKQLNLPYGMHAVRENNGFFLHIYNIEEDIKKEWDDAALEDGVNSDFEVDSDILMANHEVIIPCLYSSNYSRMVLRIYPYEDFGKMDFREENLKNRCIQYFDYDTIKRKLHVRTRQSGDYLILDTQGSRKKLNRYFIDHKMPASERDRVPLLAEGSHILWVPEGRISEDCKVQKSTRIVLKAEIEKKDDNNR